ncbi:unnamed protein product [Closterium sp. Naga37s-1]|nr:unnamed protein product [Closterium sp. Naga37s-1]
MHGVLPAGVDFQRRSRRLWATRPLPCHPLFPPCPPAPFRSPPLLSCTGPSGVDSQRRSRQPYEHDGALVTLTPFVCLPGPPSPLLPGAWGLQASGVNSQNIMVHFSFPPTSFVPLPGPPSPLLPGAWGLQGSNLRAAPGNWSSPRGAAGDREQPTHGGMCMTALTHGCRGALIPTRPSTPLPPPYPFPLPLPACTGPALQGSSAGACRGLPLLGPCPEALEAAVGVMACSALQGSCLEVTFESTQKSPRRGRVPEALKAAVSVMVHLSPTFLPPHLSPPLLKLRVW